MNPFGAGNVVVSGGHVVDDGDFSTGNNDNVWLRAFEITRDGTHVAGAVPPNPRGWREPQSARPAWLLDRPTLAAQDLAELVANVEGDYKIRLWGGVSSNPEWFEIGSANPADNGATAVDISTMFHVGPDPLTLLRQGVTQLERSDAYKKGFTNVVQGTKKCRKALDELT